MGYQETPPETHRFVENTFDCCVFGHCGVDKGLNVGYNFGFFSISFFFLGIRPRVHNDKVWPLNFAMLFWKFSAFVKL